MEAKGERRADKVAGDNPNGVPPNDSHNHPLHLLPPGSKGSIGQRALGTVAPWRGRDSVWPSRAVSSHLPDPTSYLLDCPSVRFSDASPRVCGSCGEQSRKNMVF